MQLEVEKRGQGGSIADSVSVSPKLSSLPAMNLGPAVLNQNVIKVEGSVLSNCSSPAATISNSILGSQALTPPLPTMVKLEDVTVAAGKPIQLQAPTQLITKIQSQTQHQMSSIPQQRSPKLQTKPQSQPTSSSLQQFFISHQGGVSQVLGQPQTLLTTSGQPQTVLTSTGQAGTQILLPVSLPNNATAIQLPRTNVSLQVSQNRFLMNLWSNKMSDCQSLTWGLWLLHFSLSPQPQIQVWHRLQFLSCRTVRWRRCPASS